MVITGVSGSGKSTLAFDLLFAEGQRRFLDSMNAYARQFVDQMARPEVDLIDGLPPTVSIEQRTTRGGGKSTVATVTEVHHFLRLLFARLGATFCPDCQARVQAQTRDQLGASLAAEIRKRGDLLLLAPVVRNRKGFHTDVAEWAARHGYAEIRADGKIYRSDQPFRLDRYREHDVEMVIGVLDRTRSRGFSSARRAQKPSLSTSSAPRPDSPSRERASLEMVETALEVGHGTLLALDNHRRTTVHSTERACPGCGRSFPPLDPKNFSYNSSQGWCPRCRGFGELFYLPDVERGANADAIEESWYGWAEERETCPECGGTRLNPLARAVRLPVPGAKGRKEDGRGPSITAFGEMSVCQAAAWFRRHPFGGREGVIARDILPEIQARLRFLEEVGLGYLQLGRGVTTLSGGEAQRIRLAAQLGSNLSGVLYVLDEPTIGLHARDNDQLLAALAVLRGRGNSVVVVEHDEATMRQADHIIDLGPGAGLHGGQVVAAGTLAELIRHQDSVTGKCLKTRKSYPARGERRSVRIGPGAGALSSSGDRLAECAVLVLHQAALHNLKNLTVRFPLNRFVVVTGVSGSGKSTLVRECLLPALTAALQPRARAGRGSGSAPGDCHVTGFEPIARRA